MTTLLEVNLHLQFEAIVYQFGSFETLISTVLHQKFKSTIPFEIVEQFFRQDPQLRHRDGIPVFLASRGR